MLLWLFIQYLSRISIFLLVKIVVCYFKFGMYRIIGILEYRKWLINNLKNSFIILFYFNYIYTICIHFIVTFYIFYFTQSCSSVFCLSFLRWFSHFFVANYHQIIQNNPGISVDSHSQRRVDFFWSILDIISMKWNVLVVKNVGYRLVSISIKKKK